MAHLFNVVVYDSFNRKNVKISTTYYFLDFSFFMSQDDAHYQNHLNAPHVLYTLVVEVREIDHKYSSSILSASMAAMFRQISTKAECSVKVHLPVCAAAAEGSTFINLHHRIIICC